MDEVIDIIKKLTEAFKDDDNIRFVLKDKYDYDIPEIDDINSDTLIYIEDSRGDVYIDWIICNFDRGKLIKDATEFINYRTGDKCCEEYNILGNLMLTVLVHDKRIEDIEELLKE